MARNQGLHSTCARSGSSSGCHRKAFLTQGSKIWNFSSLKALCMQFLLALFISLSVSGNLLSHSLHPTLPASAWQDDKINASQTNCWKLSCGRGGEGRGERKKKHHTPCSELHSFNLAASIAKAKVTKYSKKSVILSLLLQE